MRRVSYFITISADGMYADRDGGLAGFEPDEPRHRYANGLMDAAGDLVISRGMYDVMTYWDDLALHDESVPEIQREFATFWRQTPKHVVSRGTPNLRENAHLVDGDAVEAVRRMKAGDGPAIMIGTGAEFLADLTRARLIDDYRVVIAPLALGQGKSLFARLDEPLPLRLTGTRPFPDGSVLLEYVRTDDARGEDAI